MTKKVLLAVAAIVVLWIAGRVVYGLYFSDAARVNAIVRGLPEPLNRNDLPAFMAFISEDYHDQYGSRSQLEGRVREALEIIEPGSITVSSVDVETDADRAKVRLMAHAKPVRSFDPVLGDLADTAQHVRLLLKFQHEGQAWRIIHSEVLLSTMN